ncbi:MAG: lipopolysaccharide heptosyltransferase II [Candidatus Omnitrophota bacterium]|nr:lipopolysaccharide heptosyltransferase II [Candidatus Omnitrophota bacterium]
MTKENAERPAQSAQRRIVIFNVNWLGDVLFSTPAIKLLKQSYPGAFISCIIPPHCREILEGNPNLDEIIIYDEKGMHRSIFGKIRFIFSLRKGKFDKGFLFHRSFTRALILFLAGVKERIGYANKKRAFLLTGNVIAYNKDKMHRADYYFDLVKSYLNFSRYRKVYNTFLTTEISQGKSLESANEIGGRNFSKETDFKLDFFIPEKERTSAEKILADSGIVKDEPFVVFNPGGNWLAKRWIMKNFADLAQRLVGECKIKVIISGSEKDAVLAEGISALTKVKLCNFCGKLTLKQAAALAKMARVFISGDSGPLHIAYASGASVIGLYGPTATLITGPYHAGNAVVIQKDVGCDIPCYKEGCQELRCMKAITVEDVLERIKTIVYTPQAASNT